MALLYEIPSSGPINASTINRALGRAETSNLSFNISDIGSLLGRTTFYSGGGSHTDTGPVVMSELRGVLGYGMITVAAGDYYTADGVLSAYGIHVNSRIYGFWRSKTQIVPAGTASSNQVAGGNIYGLVGYPTSLFGNVTHSFGWSIAGDSFAFYARNLVSYDEAQLAILDGADEFSPIPSFETDSNGNQTIVPQMILEIGAGRWKIPIRMARSGGLGRYTYLYSTASRLSEIGTTPLPTSGTYPFRLVRHPKFYADAPYRDQ